MQETEQITCPFCGQDFELIIDTTLSKQSFATDCEVCCRPLLIRVECEAGEILFMDATPN